MGRHPRIAIDDVVRLRNAGFTVNEIAEDLECGISTVAAALNRAGLTGHYSSVRVERQRLLDLWASEKTLSEIGCELGCSTATVLRLGKTHKLPVRTQFKADPDDFVSPEEDMASADSLRLSPWVQARIRELGLGMPA